jgi:hypothetical protein
MSDTDDSPRPNDDHAAGDDHRRRIRTDFSDLIEDMIEDGRRRGLFDGLAGRGRPLDLEENAYEGSARLANKLLKDNDLRPPWLSRRVDVVDKIDTLRTDINRTWARYRVAFEQAQGQSHRPALTIGWDDACRGWEEAIVALNKEIETYNLKRPLSQLELFKLRLGDELKRVDAPRYLL